MLAQILADAGQSERVLIYTLIGGHVVTIVTLIVKSWVDQRNRDRDAKKDSEKAAAEMARREADRLDAESKAKVILNELAAQEARVRLAAIERESRIRDDIRENTEKTKEGIAKSEEALNAANGVNSKIERHSEDVAKATEVIAEATKVLAEKVVEKPLT